MNEKVVLITQNSEDHRLVCAEADGGGHHAEYKVKGHDDILVIYDLYDENGNVTEYRWTPVRIVNGRLSSGIYPSYYYSTDLVDAIEDGTVFDQD